MKSAVTVWLIRRGSAARPVCEYAHEVGHFIFEWSADIRRARRFKAKAEAERFAANLLAGPFHAAEFALRDLVRAADERLLTGEVEDLLAF